jgi:hypothetical protein
VKETENGEWEGVVFGPIRSIKFLAALGLMDGLTTSRKPNPPNRQALAYVLLWQYALCVPMLIAYVTLFLAIIQSVRPRSLLAGWLAGRRWIGLGFLRSERATLAMSANTFTLVGGTLAFFGVINISTHTHMYTTGVPGVSGGALLLLVLDPSFGDQ